MKCIYLRLRNRTKDGSIRRIESARSAQKSVAKPTTTEERLLRKLQKINRERNDILVEIQQYLEEQKLNNGDDEGSECILLKKISRVRSSGESSGYSTAGDVERLIRGRQESTSSEEIEEAPRFKVDSEYGHVLHTFGKSIEKIETTFYESEEDSEYRSTDQTVDWSERRRHSRVDTAETECLTEESVSICRSYQSVSWQKWGCSKNKDAFTSELREITETWKGEHSKRALAVQKCLEQRILRGRVRLGKRRIVSERPEEFATLSEVMEERQFPGNAVVICSLCRLLISNSLREEFFMSPCDCRDKFVHSECALLHMFELTQQECDDCGKMKEDRVICRSRSPSPSRREEYDLHQLNKESAEKYGKPLYRRRLPEHFEHHCHICLDQRKPREDEFERRDATLVRACICRVTAHNQCLVQSLPIMRICPYCKYELKFKMIRPRADCWVRRIPIQPASLLILIVSISTFLIYSTFTRIQLSHQATDISVKVSVSAAIASVSVLLILWITREWTREACEEEQAPAIVMQHYQSPTPIEPKVGKRDQWEELPFQEWSLEQFLRSSLEKDVELGT